jgi:UMF1 family MFS transporter
MESGQSENKKEISNYKRVVNSWALYHWADNAFSTTIMAAILPVYYSHVAASTLSANSATAYWGYTSAITVIISALMAPVLGTLANIYGLRKRMLLAFAALGIFTTAFLYFIKTGDWLMASVIFIVSNIGFSLGDVMHDSLLPHVAKTDDIDRVSSRGFALGYLGGAILLAINVATIRFMSDKELAVRLSFLSVSVWWAAFTIPLILNVREPASDQDVRERESSLLAGYRLLESTYRNLKRYRQLMVFLAAFLIYNDGIGTIIRMATIYGAELGLGRDTLIGALLMTLIIGAPFSILFGRLAKHIGAKNCIYICLVVYTFISVGGYFITKPIDFWILAFMVGTVQGGAQALSRSLYGSMIPQSKTAEFFGFYGMSSRIGGFVGPLLFAVVSQLTSNSRYSIVSIVIFFIVGTVLLTKVDVNQGVKTARDEDEGIDAA